MLALLLLVEKEKLTFALSPSLFQLTGSFTLELERPAGTLPPRPNPGAKIGQLR